MGTTPVPSGAPAPPGRRPRGVRRRLREGLPAVVLAAPALLAFGVFAWWPLLRGAVMSLRSSELVTDPEWVGLANFAYVLADPLLATAVVNTLWFCLLALALGFPLPVLLAVVLTELRRTRALAAVLVYLPVVLPPVVAVLLWQTFYAPGPAGPLNAVLGVVGVPPQAWLGSTTWAMPAVVLQVTWASAGSAVVVYLAALAGVRAELYEAAELDGAGVLARLRHVTLPHLRGVLLVMLLLQLLGTAQVFTEPTVLTGGGPQRSTTTVLMVVYEYFRRNDVGAAAALGVLLALTLSLVSLSFWRATRRWGTT